MSKPRKQTIEKYTLFLEDLAKLDTITKTNFSEKIRKYRLNNGISSHMIALGYIISVNNKNLKIGLLKVMPIHAVQLLNSLNNARVIANNKKMISMNVTEKNVVKNQLKKQICTTESKTSSHKHFSILWGVLSIKW